MFTGARPHTRLIILSFFTCLLLLVWYASFKTPSVEEQHLKIHFLNVGQGDAILIESPSGIQVLVDGGPDNSVLRELGKKMSFFDRHIDMVVATHPDADHIGGLIDVLNRYKIENILYTNNKSETAVSDMYQNMLQQEGAVPILARYGQVFDLGAGVFLKVLFPIFDTTDIESNASSIILKVVYGDTKFLFTGDSPKRIEEYLVVQGIDVKSDVLKVGHHGSRTSTSKMFLTAVKPQYAVISAGKDNRYEHPHLEVTDMLFNHGVKILSTAEEGTISFESDGRRVWREE